MIRPFIEGDFDAIVHLLDECFGPALREQRRAWFDWTIRNYEALAQLHQPPYGDYAIALKDSGALIGSVGLVPSFGPFNTLPLFRDRNVAHPTILYTPEMGLFWALDPAHRGAGYATEAAAAMASFLFSSLHVRRLVATTEHSNLLSIAVMRRLGMTIERNPTAEPHWFQTVGVLLNPKALQNE